MYAVASCHSLAIEVLSLCVSPRHTR
uniref:Uncharacterized protein n=1 Tax=Anguilla anguilla TaxID=7936 RepID=A0A0E9XB50_ANGAN